VPARKNKRGRIIEESSSVAQEGGAQQNYVPPYGGIGRHQVTTVVHQCKHRGVVQPCPPPNYVVPNVAFVESYEHFPQPQ
jgi:hypothetical protein